MNEMLSTAKELTERLPVASDAACAQVRAGQMPEPVLPGAHRVELGGTAWAGHLPKDVSVLSWRMQGCLHPEATADLLAEENPDVLLLTEMDVGCDRSGQKHMPYQLAGSMGMAYAFGAYGFEPGTEAAPNAAGWQGPAVLSSVPPLRAAVIRLEDMQASAGSLQGAVAVAMLVQGADYPVCLVSAQMDPARHSATLETALQEFAPAHAVLMGVTGLDTDRFDALEAVGFQTVADGSAALASRGARMSQVATPDALRPGPGAVSPYAPLSALMSH